MDYEFHPLSEQEYYEAIDFFAAIDSDLAEAFIREIESAIIKICDRPEMYPRVSAHVQRCLVRTFPYGVLYQADERILIVAVMQLNRRPGYWKDRVK